MHMSTACVDTPLLLEGRGRADLQNIRIVNIPLIRSLGAYVKPSERGKVNWVTSCPVILNSYLAIGMPQYGHGHRI